MPDFLVLLDRYRTGECTPDEAAEVERRLAADAVQGHALAWLDELDRDVGRLHPPEPWDADGRWREARAAMQAAAPHAPPRLSLLPERRRASWAPRLLRIAAAVGLIAGAIALWRAAGLRQETGESVQSRTFATRLGERAVFRLADGSQVTLAPGSRLDVGLGYGRQNRDVRLDGEGYFEVEPNSAAPFRVHTGRAITQVLGTKFGVRAYQTDSVATVVVAEGSVAFTSRSQSPASIVLAPGDLARLARGDRLSVEHGVTVSRYLGWAQGRLAFVNAPLRDVAVELGRWYDLEIVLADSSLASRPLTASFQKESAPHMLQLLARTLDLRVEQRGRSVTLHANP